MVLLIAMMYRIVNGFAEHNGAWSLAANCYMERTETYTGHGSIEHNEASSIHLNVTVDHMNVNGSVGNTEAPSMIVGVSLITLKLSQAVTVLFITLKPRP
jgi:hypothetical protein